MKVILTTTSEKWNVAKYNRTFQTMGEAVKYLRRLVMEIPQSFFGEEYDEEMDEDEMYEGYKMCYVKEEGDGYIVFSNENSIKYGTPDEIRVEII